MWTDAKTAFENNTDSRRDWLMKADRLVAAFQDKIGPVSISKRQESRQQPFADEARALSLKGSVHLREVLISRITEPKIDLCYARVLIPDQTWALFSEDFQALGSQFIGNTLLYDNPEVQRSDFEFAFIPSGSDYAWALGELTQTSLLASPLAARRSIFYWKEQPLLVTEALLPELINLPYNVSHL